MLTATNARDRDCAAPIPDADNFSRLRPTIAARDGLRSSHGKATVGYNAVF